MRIERIEQGPIRRTASVRDRNLFAKFITRPTSLFLLSPHHNTEESVPPIYATSPFRLLGHQATLTTPLHCLRVHIYANFNSHPSSLGRSFRLVQVRRTSSFQAKHLCISPSPPLFIQYQRLKCLPLWRRSMTPFMTLPML